MGLIDSAFKAFRKRKGDSKQQSPRGKEASRVQLVERRQDPGIIGRADFGGVVCGYDLSDECFSDGFVIRMTGTNWRKAMDDFMSLERFFELARDHDKTFPTSLRVSIYDEAAPRARLFGLTPTGRKPKYAMEVSFDVQEPTVEPEDWDTWIDGYATSDAKAREAMGKALHHEAYSQDCIHGTISYLQSGRIGKARFNIWHGRTCYSLDIKSAKERLFLAKSTRYDAIKERTVVTYDGNNG